MTDRAGFTAVKYGPTVPIPRFCSSCGEEWKPESRIYFWGALFECEDCVDPNVQRLLG